MAASGTGERFVRNWAAAIVTWVAVREMILATHLAAAGDWWFHRAARRAGKFSANIPTATSGRAG
jgi:hypothetical protein